jgi:hypothetical protein
MTPEGELCSVIHLPLAPPSQKAALFWLRLRLVVICCSLFAIPYFSPLAIYAAPIIATNSSTLATSNGAK